MSTFISEFTTLIDDLNSSPSELIITGDFNIHVDKPTLPDPSTFLSTLDSADLRQHVKFPTHKYGHTLDLLISRATSNIISTVEWTIPFISDHYAIQATLTIPSYSRPPLVTKLVRAFRSIDVASLSHDIYNSPLHTSTSTPTTVDGYLALFTSTLSSIIDKHAPLKMIRCLPRTRKPFINQAILTAKTVRSKLESIYRRTKLPSDLTIFKNQSKALSKLISTSRRSYYRSLISRHKNQPRQLWSTLNSLLSRKSAPSLPTTTCYKQLSSTFLQFFDDKISKLCLAFTKTPIVSPIVQSPVTPPSLVSFEPATIDEIQSAILSSNDSTCSLDIIPTYLLKSCLPSLLIPITTLVNLSLSEGSFPTPYKQAIVKPLLKKYNLPPQDLASYRPISNLNFISKIIERIMHSRLSTHLNTFPSISPFQSAYRRLHSTETALLRIQNDLLTAMNQQKLTALVLLDLSAAFDTIDHTILLSRLSSFYGISGSALDLVSSYLHDRTQSVSINGCSTVPTPMLTGVPQGSVLGPLLFSLYTSPISQIFSNSAVSYHLYADDTQLYISFSASDSTQNLAKLSSTLDSVHSWLFANRLTVNPSKTEYLLIGTPQQRSKVTSCSIQFHGTTLTPSGTSRNLGITYDSDLSLKKHIASVCQTGFYHIRQLRQVRSSLDTNSATVLANSLVSSRLDYCNSLFYGLPDCSIHRLQRVQNSLARVVLPFVKRQHHITPALQKLHWLPVKKRILSSKLLLSHSKLSIISNHHIYMNF